MLSSKSTVTVTARGFAIGSSLVVAIALSGCGSGITASTRCSEFLHASLQDQDAAVFRVASDMRAGNAVTPLGRPNVNYICANAPDKTLGDVVRQTG